MEPPLSAEEFILEGNLLSPPSPPARARVRVRSGRIAAVEELERSPAARDLAGNVRSLPQDVWVLPPDVWILPGFVDGHTHLLSLGLAHLKPDLSASGNRTEALAMLESWLSEHPGDAPVIAEGFDQSTWPDPSVPTRAELDRIAPRRPVALRRVCGHVAILNSAALARLGPQWPDLDPDSGLAREALPLSLARLWPPSLEQRDEAVERGQSAAWKAGVTAIHEMGNGDTFRAFARAARGGRLGLRVTHFFNVELLDALISVGMTAGHGDGHLRVGGLKIFLDGSIGGRSAAVRVPYADAAGEGAGEESTSKGLLLWPDQKLFEVLERAARFELPVAMHAIGDRAIDQAIRGVERLRERALAPARPGPRLEHAEMLDAELLERAVACGMRVSMQPNFTARWQGPGQLYETALGPARAAALNRYGSVSETGRLHLGSDTMPMDPLLGLVGAMSHPRPEERLSFPQAVRHYTASGATAVYRPFGEGRVVPGEPADLILLRLPGPPPDLSPDQARRAEVLATWVAGELRHAAAALSSVVAPW